MSEKQYSILFLTKYSRNGASSRYRTFQYIPKYENAGIHCVVAPLFDDIYLKNRYHLGKGKFNDILKAFLSRLWLLAHSRSFSLVVIEKEVLPYFPAVLERLLSWFRVPYVVDYDDALFHQYDDHNSALIRRFLGGKIARVMKGASHVIVGNSYMADYAQKAGVRDITIIPTVVDLDRYPFPERNNEPVEGFTIGWIGSPATAKYLKAIASALAEVCTNGKGRLLLIGSGPVDLPGVPLEVLDWNEANEVDLLQQCDVGIMPLPDELWERGKCGSKLIHYMASGLPVIASPVGVNTEIVEENMNGFLAVDHDSWVRALTLLRDDRELGLRMGRAGREKVEHQYCLQITGPKLVSLLIRSCNGYLVCV